MSDIVIAREYQRGRVVLASPESLKPAILDVTKVAVWGAKAVSCCVVSNGLEATQLGVARRSVLGPNAGKSSHLVVSETLVAVRNSPLKTFVTFSLTDPMLAKRRNPTDVLKEGQVEMLKSASITGHKPRLGAATSSSSSSCAEQPEQQQQQQHRRNAHPSDAVPGALYMDTTMSVSPVDSDPEKSFVEIFVEFGAADASKAEEIAFFLDKCWAGPLLDSLADYALNISFPVQKGPTDLEFRKLYERHEDTVVRLCAKKHIDDELKARTEALLDALYASYRDTVAAQARTEHMKEETHSAQILLRESNQRIVELQTELNTTQSQLLLLRHAGEPQQQEQVDEHERTPVSPSPVAALNDRSNAVGEAGSASADVHSNGSSRSTGGGVQQQQHQQQQLLTGAVSDKPQKFVLTPEQRSQQVVSAIDEFSVPRSQQQNSQQHRAESTYKQLVNPVFGQRMTEDRLREKFSALDADRAGFLTVEQLAGLLAAIDPADDFDIKERLARERQLTPRGGARSRTFAASAAKAELENPARNPREAVHFREALEFCQRYCADKSGKRISFDEFSIFYLKLERAM